MTFEKLEEEFDFYIKNSNYKFKENEDGYGLSLEEIKHINKDILYSWYNFQNTFNEEKTITIKNETSYFNMIDSTGRRSTINVNLNNSSFVFFNAFPNENSRKKLVSSILLIDIDNVNYLNQKEDTMEIDILNKLKPLLINTSDSSFQYWDNRLEVDFSLFNALNNLLDPYFCIRANDSHKNDSEFLTDFFGKKLLQIIVENRRKIQQELVILNSINEILQKVFLNKEDYITDFPSGTFTLSGFTNAVKDYNDFLVLTKDISIINEKMIDAISFSPNLVDFKNKELIKKTI